MPPSEILNKRYTQSYRRVIGASITVILALVLLSFLVTQKLFVHHKNLDAIRSNLNAQIEIWGKIDRIILYEVNGNIDPNYAKDVLGKKMQESVAENLEKSRILSEKLDQQLADLMETKLYAVLGGDLSPITFASSIDKDIINGVDRFTRVPFELIMLADRFWDVDVQIPFRSGKYMEPLQNTLSLVESRRSSVQSISIMIFIGLNLLVVTGILLIWRLTLRPAFDKMQREHMEKMNVISKLADRNADFKASFFALEHAAAIVGRNGHLRYLNPLFADLFSIEDNEEMSGNIFDYLSTLEPASPSSQREQISSIHDLVALGEQGEVFLIGGRHYSVSSSNVTQERWIVLFSDYEAFMRNKETELNKKRLETLDYISAGVAHDFNNILGSILSRAEMMELSIESKNEISSAKSDIQSIIESCKRGKAVTSNLLSYARQTQLNKQSLSTGRFLETLQKQVIVPDNIQLSFENNLSATIDADIMQLVTAVENLIRNSIDSIHGDQGEIRVVVDTDAEFPSLAAICVEDNGPGFSPKAIEQASDPFFSTKSLTHGNGLGLSMVAGFASQSSGLMSYGNLESGGAYVQISLPIESHEVDDENSESDQKTRAIHDIKAVTRCLIIEDNHEICNTLAVFFKTTFKSIDTAITCEIAEKLVQGDSQFDVVICDWTLPDGDSQNVIQMMLEKSPQTKIIVTTGNVGMKLRALADEADLTVIEKPFSLHELREIVEQNLNLLALEKAASLGKQRERLHELSS